MNENKHNDEWREGDETWQLLGKAAPKQASARFADDVVRAVRLLPEVDPFWPRILKFSTWSVATACVLLTASIFLDGPKEQNLVQQGPQEIVRNHSVVTVDAKWQQIEDVAEAELLVAAADHLDRFSDQELISMVGF